MSFLDFGSDVIIQTQNAQPDPGFLSSPAGVALVAVGGVLATIVANLWLGAARARHERAQAREERQATNQRTVLADLFTQAIDIRDRILAGTDIFAEWAVRELDVANNITTGDFRRVWEPFAVKRHLVADEQLRTTIGDLNATLVQLWDRQRDEHQAQIARGNRDHPWNPTQAWLDDLADWGPSAADLPETIGAVHQLV